MTQPLAEGQWLTHARFGIGVTRSSDERRTTIAFDDHGEKTFVTAMLEAELIPPPDRPHAGSRRRKPARPRN